MSQERECKNYYCDVHGSDSFSETPNSFSDGILICGIYSYMEAEKLYVCLDFSVLFFFVSCEMSQSIYLPAAFKGKGTIVETLGNLNV